MAPTFTSSSLISMSIKRLTGMIDQPEHYGELCDDEDVKSKINVTTKDHRKLAVDVGQNTDQIIEVKVPKGSKPGEPVTVAGPDGCFLRARIPEGLTAGDSFFVPVPKMKGGLFSWGKKQFEVEPLQLSGNASAQQLAQGVRDLVPGRTGSSSSDVSLNWEADKNMH